MKLLSCVCLFLGPLYLFLAAVLLLLGRSNGVQAIQIGLLLLILSFVAKGKE